MKAFNQDRIWTLVTRKLAGETTPAELDELETLLLLHPELESTLQAVEGFWNNQQEPDKEFMEATYLLHLDRMRGRGFDLDKQGPDQRSGQLDIPKKINNSILRRTALFTFFILLIVIPVFNITQKRAGIIGEQAEKRFKSEVSTKNGSRTRIVLPDGSVVFLNAGSKLNYDKNFGNSLREVKLIGEGFFDVVRNPEKPFKIYTEAVEIKVLGTQFNVKSYPGDKTTETSLIRGSVEVTLKDRPNEKYILKPNEKLVVQNESGSPAIDPPRSSLHEPIVAIRNLRYLQGEQTAVEALWTKNELSFQDETFVEISEKMKRWYDVSFEFRNPRRKNTRFTGSFKNETLQEALEAMRYTSAFRFEIKDKVVTIY